MAFKKNDIKDIYSLSPLQEGMLFHYLMDENSKSNAYFVQMSFTLQTGIDRILFEKAINKIIEKYDILRTVFIFKKVKTPQQVVLKKREAEVAYKDISHLPGKAQLDYIREFEREDRNRGFDLSREVLMRISLIRISTHSYRVIFSFHHIIMDGWCLGILVKDIFYVYHCLWKGQAIYFPRPPSYSNYIKWLEKQDKEAGLSYWKDYLAGYRKPAGLKSNRKSDKMTGEFSHRYKQEFYTFALDERLTQTLAEIASGSQVTINSIIQTTWGILLQKYNNTDDVVYGSVVSGRPAEIEGIETMIGLFINTIPVRIITDSGETFIQLLRRVQQQEIESKTYEYLPLPEIQSRSLLKRDLLDHLLAFENYPIEQGVREAVNDPTMGIKIDNLSTFEQTNYDFNINVGPGKTISIIFNFNGLVFELDYIKRLSVHFQEILKQVSADPGLEITKIEVITGDEKKQLLCLLNNRETAYPKDKTLHELFADQAERIRDHMAVEFKNPGPWYPKSVNSNTANLTYHELNARANQLAYSLNEKGVRPDTLVAIIAEPSLEMIIGILGILKAGGAYLPIEPDYPQERINYMLADSGAKMLVTTQALVEEDEKLSRWEDGRIRLEEIPNSPKRSTHPLTLLPSYLQNSSDLAYIIYTSGSTGRPKGTLIQHRNVVSLLFHEGLPFDFGPHDVWTLFHSYCFDFSVWEMYGALLYGGRLIVIPRMIVKEPGRFLEVLEGCRVTVLNQTPSAFYSLSAVALQDSSKSLKFSIRYIIFGGEALDASKLREWNARYPLVKLINMYGITETTVHVTFKEIGKQEIESGWSNIGRPLATMRGCVMDKNLGLLPVGIPGELCVGGAGLARGYLNKPELTAKKFVANPYCPMERIYRSGDQVRLWDKDKNQEQEKKGEAVEMEYMGRLDSQVKIRGFRVELGEIESKLRKHESIHDAVVIARERGEGKIDDGNAEIQLYAYLVSEKKLAVPVWREYLMEELPGYMIPSYFIYLDRLPLTSNGKVDRKALRLPSVDIGMGKGRLGPRNQIDEKLIGIFSEILEIEKGMIGINSDFFEIGGHSLSAVKLASRIHKEFDVKVSIAAIFENSELAKLSDYLRFNSAVQEKYRDIEAVEEKEYYVVSSAQKRVYIMQQMDRNSTGYNLPMIQVWEGQLEIKRIEETFVKLIKRYESLRTSFKIINDETVQVIHKDAAFEIEYHEGDEASAKTMVKGFLKPFALDRTPLFRVGLIDLGESKGESEYTRRFVFMLDMHHIISDGTSITILAGEFLSRYQGKEAPELRIQYKDFSEWQHQAREQEYMKQQERYWTQVLSRDLPVLNLPIDYKRPPVQGFEGSNCQFALDLNESQKLRDLASMGNVTLFMVILAIYSILLSKISGQEDIIIGTGTAGRRHEDLGKIIGMFINMLALRTYPGSDQTFKNFLEEIKNTTINAFDNQDTPFEELVTKLRINRYTGRNPLFDAVLEFQNINIPPATVKEKAISNVKILPVEFENRATPFDLVLEGMEVEGKFLFTFLYSTKLFKEETIKRFSQYFKEIIAAISENEELRLREINISHGLLSPRKKKFNDDEGFAF